MQYYSPAKINLFLKILGKRPDGFHEIETFMVPTSLCDLITLTTQPSGIVLTCSDPSLPTNQKNLAYRAAQIFFEKTQISGGVYIHIEKKIPHGGGLGGGSSNAATVLKALRNLHAPEIPDQTLQEWIAPLGSDIPFFISPKPAICKGRGEIITHIPFSGAHFALLIFPPFSVPTPWAYKTYAQHPTQGETSHTWPYCPLRNDLEPAVFSKFITLAVLKDWLRKQTALGVFDALMSGSGSTMIAFLHPDADVTGLKKLLKTSFGESFQSHIIQFPKSSPL
ncbi:MAG: 4-(cytidine 5'-diphospho)-2-C-methyl-D-erythritol kinase [Methylacidiphilales bacterium]|nr:4-(cytidine 5'-diphospho)-2-C-methyl-D-erythritol kinase [Candidatus Methylacidiphilales bacterium]MDW8349932.1 4-(cytidine 5'-diphospho)-2-C-methyl-D-erythritol kinase [Verrucomicrobiae bacterium]